MSDAQDWGDTAVKHIQDAQNEVTALKRMIGGYGGLPAVSDDAWVAANRLEDARVALAAVQAAVGRIVDAQLQEEREAGR